MNSQKDITLSPVLVVLAYFDVFDYPLTYNELKLYTKGLGEEELKAEITRLKSNSLIVETKNLFGLISPKDGGKEIVEGKKRADRYRKKAIRRAKFIGKFPFVRGVCISGSFSKGFMPKDGDVDFFIVTKHNRLWLARTSLILYKKIVLFNSRKFFCVNYFISEKELKIDQQNIFTATELFTLIPVVNKGVYHQLIEVNGWYENYYDKKLIGEMSSDSFRRSTFQLVLEPLLNTGIGDKLDRRMMKITLSRWMKKFPDLPSIDFEIAFKTTRNVSKHHPSNFQKRVLKSFEERKEQLILKDGKHII